MTNDNFAKPDGNLPDWRQNDTKPLDADQRKPEGFQCKDTGMTDCEYKFEAIDVDAVKEALEMHYLEAHPGHKVADTQVLMDAERYRA